MKINSMQLSQSTIIKLSGHIADYFLAYGAEMTVGDGLRIGVEMAMSDAAIASMPAHAGGTLEQIAQSTNLRYTGGLLFVAYKRAVRRNQPHDPQLSADVDGLLRPIVVARLTRAATKFIEALEERFEVQIDREHVEPIVESWLSTDMADSYRFNLADNIYVDTGLASALPNDCVVRIVGPVPHAEDWEFLTKQMDAFIRADIRKNS